jgi:hypothetical protein
MIDPRLAAEIAATLTPRQVAALLYLPSDGSERASDGHRMRNAFLGLSEALVRGRPVGSTYLWHATPLGLRVRAVVRDQGFWGVAA